MRAELSSDLIVVSATKGIETDTGKRISEIVADVLGESSSPRFVCLSGPSFASEVIAKHPTAVSQPAKIPKLHESFSRS